MLWGYRLSIGESCWRRTLPPRYFPRWIKSVYQTQQWLFIKLRSTNQLTSHESSSWRIKQRRGDKFQRLAEAFLLDVRNFIHLLRAGFWWKDWISWRWEYASLCVEPRKQILDAQVILERLPDDRLRATLRPDHRKFRKFFCLLIHSMNARIGYSNIQLPESKKRTWTS